MSTDPIVFIPIGDILKPRFYVFPNPAKDVVYVAGEMKGNERYRLTRLDGTTISSGHFDGSIDVAGIMDGMYILSVENDKHVESYKVIVRK